MDCHCQKAEQLPVGYRFLPTDEELVTHYLMNKAHYRPLPAQVIQDIDATAFYSEPPKNIDAVSFPNGEREWYFFVHEDEEIVGESTEKEMKINVGDGLGFWKGIGQEEPICNSDGNVFAFKFHFIYFSGSFSNPKKTHWKMDKYRLPTHNHYSTQASKGEEWILLRLRRGIDYKTYF